MTVFFVSNLYLRNSTYLNPVLLLTKKVKILHSILFILNLTNAYTTTSTINAVKN